MLRFALAVYCLSLVCPTLGQSLPQVDLGYEVHQALYLNTSSQTYHFNNIRFAQPPVGNLRFAAPVAPTGRDTAVQNGSTPRICPQASPAWALIARDFTAAYLTGRLSTFNYTQQLANLTARIAALPASSTVGITEDCLFLDVVAPKTVFDNSRNMRKRQSGGVPVLVWIYGGGFTFGSKDLYSVRSQGLIKSSQRNGSRGVIFVAINYRLGAFGWLGGPTFQAAGGVSNAGLYDQRLAIEWVKANIAKFGGDPNQITLMGESAGGSSIQHQITAYGGLRNVSFQRAILQSPGFGPIAGQNQQETTALGFLALLNVTSFAAARNLSLEVLIRANALQVGASPYGQFTYGPTVDGIFVPALPGISLNAGNFAKNISVMTGFNTNEGLTFGIPDYQGETSYAQFVRLGLPTLSDANAQYILNVLYPPIYNGSYGYTSPLERSFAVTGDLAFKCNANYVQRAFGGRGYAYEFASPPAYHGFDVDFTFYNGQGTNLTTGLVAPVAEALQAYITNFALTGNPNGAGSPLFPPQGSNASANALNITGVRVERDPTVGPRCTWWQKALYT